ncbi:MAG TPA: large conductance mechanosensitive channel protein MscL [Solirubrobacteraceae bacterium]|nr:large conductance mechanosensitive channel protein MscL [Solirubrobacteraceae bacterium]
MLKEFRDFIMRGNVIDLAVAVVIGAAFTQVVNAFVTDIVTPLIGAITGGDQFFGDRSFEINGSQFLYGDLINQLLTFVIVAAVVFFLVVKPLNTLTGRLPAEPSPDRPTRDCPQCLSSIPEDARRCAFCTAEIG